ncbi:MAG TPA: hypothetical protein VIX14_13575 [Terriglobales bacterium]
MNPLASTKCAGRLLMALAAISSILLMAACGSGGPPAIPNPVGFNNGSLTGTYVFSSSGSDANGNALAMAGAFTANGSGGITGGMMDVVDPVLNCPIPTCNPPIVPPSPTAQSLTISSSYNVNTDGRGTVTLVTSAYGTFTLAFVLTSTSGGLVTEFDSNGTGSGTLDLQTPVTSLSQLAGPYAFSLAGPDSGGNPLATAGAFTLNSSGTSTVGVEDFNDDAVFISPGVPLTVSATTLGSGTGPGSTTLGTGTGFGQFFDFYPIDATHLKFIETDYVDFLSGDAFTQTGASIPNGPMVFTMAGSSSAGPIANPIADGGLMTSDGTGNFPTGLEDINDAGKVPGQGQFSGALNVGLSGPAGTGRVFVDLTGFAPATNWVVYPSAGGLLMLEMDTAAITTGVGYAQSGTSFTAPGNYGLNLSGENAANGLVGPVGDIAQFAATTAVAPASNMTGILDENSLIGGTLPSISLNPGTYTPDSPATGRGLIVADTTGTVIGGLSLQYYTINSSSAVFIEVDPTQVAAGTFEQQSTPGDGAMAQSHVAIVHPAVHPHAAKRSKQIDSKQSSK